MKRGGRYILWKDEPDGFSNLDGIWTLNEIGDYISENKWNVIMAEIYLWGGWWWRWIYRGFWSWRRRRSSKR